MATSFLSIIEYKKNTFTNVTAAENQTNHITFILKKYLSYHNLHMLDCKDPGKEMDKNVISVKN